MDIHAPERPIESVRDFLLHIAVVTCGILIALGLEGIREAVHNRHLVRETRENVRFEMEGNLDNSRRELPRVTQYSVDLNKLVADLPTLREHPEQMQQRLQAITNPGYFFLANSWQSALSTGALEHMSTQEVTTYGGAAEAVKIYTQLQRDAQAEEIRSKAFFTAHPHLTPTEMEEGTERLLLFAHSEESLAFVGPQMQSSVQHAIQVATSR